MSHHLTPATAVAISMLSLFVALGGVGIAATGGSFILGNPNSASSTSTLTAPVAGKAALSVSNTSTDAGSTPLSLTAAANHPALMVNTIAKVAKLNSDLLDGFDSAAFLRKGVQATGAVGGSGGVVDAKNTGSANGVRGLTSSPEASGVYGENTSGSGGFGVAARAGAGGAAIYGEDALGGLAGQFLGDVQVMGTLSPYQLDCAFSKCIQGAQVSGKVGDADALDGIDSGGFVQGGGRAVSQAAAVQPGVNLFLGPPLGGFLRLSYACPDTSSNYGLLFVYNDSGSPANVFTESGDPNPTYRQVDTGKSFSMAAAPSGDSFHIQAQGARGVETIEVATANRASDCHAQAQALLTPQG